ncbi:MAG: NAD-dependent epimerase/dehydratase family protein [Nanoarchaeota archaeon]
MISDKNVLITGGYGFIGSNLTKHIAENSLAKNITVLDRVRPEKTSRLNSLNIRTINADIRKPEDYEDQIKDTDIIFHQAAFVSVPKSIEQPSETIETNVLGTVKLLEACRKNNIERFVFASSAAVYGEQAEPLKELSNLNPSSPYGLSKLMAEDYCRIYSKLYGIKTTCLRYFNVYGPEQAYRKYPSVMSILFSCLKEGKPFIVYGDGEHTRDYVHISDIVQANLLAATSPTLVKGEAVNIATGHAVSLNKFIELVKKLTGKNIQVSYSAPRAGDMLHSVANVSLAKERLGFETKISIEEGLRTIF